jgi:hypothetical protein
MPAWRELTSWSYFCTAGCSLKAGLNRIEVAEMRVAFPPKTYQEKLKCH